MRILIFYLLILIYSCNNNETKSSQKSDDTTTGFTEDSIHKRRVGLYKRNEQQAIDSLKHYEVLPFYDTLRGLLYKIYGTEILLEDKAKRSITVGECDIRITSFDFVGPDLRLICLDMFGTDSVPIPSDRLSKEAGVMMLCAEINVSNKSMTRASTGHMGFTPISEFKSIAESPGNLKKLRHYVDSLREKLHPKFKIAIGLN